MSSCPARQIFTSAHDALSAELARSTNVRVASDGSAQARIYALGARDNATANDPVPQLRALVKPVWAVVARDGQLMLPLTQMDAPQAAAQLALALGKLARKRALLLLENTSANNRLRGAVTCEVLTQRDGKWCPVAPMNRVRSLSPMGHALPCRSAMVRRSPSIPSCSTSAWTAASSCCSHRRRAGKSGHRSAFRFGATDGAELKIELPSDFPMAG